MNNAIGMCASQIHRMQQLAQKVKPKHTDKEQNDEIEKLARERKKKYPNPTNRVY